MSETTNVNAQDSGVAETGNSPVWVVVEVQAVHDADRYREYQLGARGQIGPRGGVVVGRGGEAVEGTPAFGPVLLQRWPSAAAFLAWQASDEYRPLKALRLRAADLRIAIVPVAPPPAG